MMIRRIGLLVAAALLGAAGACGTDTVETDPGVGGSAPPSYGTSACRGCLTQACQSELDACASDPGCAGYLECLDGCDLDLFGNADAACEAACPVANTSTAAELKAALSICRNDGPGAACVECGVVSLLSQQCGASTETDLCAVCEDENCCETYVACRDDATCQALKDCFQACPVDSDPCWDQCLVDHGDGMKLFGERMTCLWAECNTECGGDACTGCISAACPNSSAACYSLPDCFSLEGCVGDCSAETDPAAKKMCIDGCYAQYPDVVDEFTAMALCSLANCQQPCGA